MKRVAVIGAGAAGLVTIQQLTLDTQFEVVAFEQTDKVGGLWVYNEKIQDEFCGSMYRGLRTNIPRHVMGYPGFPFTSQYEDNSFVNHASVRKYLESYASHFELHKYIQFNTKVQQIRPILSCNNGIGYSEFILPRWEITTVSTNSNHKQMTDIKKTEFDYVAICNGHFNKPKYPPETPEIYSTFKGQILHSKHYRSPETFAGTKIIIVGYGLSAIDIAIETSTVATEVYLVVRNKDPLESTFPNNVKQVLGTIKLASANGLTINQFDGHEMFLEANGIIFCTGYEYSFSFLTPECHVEVNNDGKLVTPVYRHMIHTEFPSMCFIGLPVRIIPFILFYCQIKFFIYCIRNQFQNLSHKFGPLDNNASIATTDNHYLGQAQWKYDEGLIKNGQFEDSKMLQEMIDFCQATADKYNIRRHLFPGLYKNDQILVTTTDEGDGRIGFEYIEAATE